jgi:3-oxoadipate enol-lactonase
MVFALKYPGRTQSLLATSAVSQVDPLLRGMIDMWGLAAQEADPDLLYRVVYPLTFSEPWIAANMEVLEAARARYKTLDMRAFGELIRCFAELDITAQLHQIQAPTLVVVGEHDLLKPRSYAEVIYREIPNAELAIVPHAGHAAMWEQPGVFNTLVLGFVAKHAGGGG